VLLVFFFALFVVLFGSVNSRAEDLCPLTLCVEPYTDAKAIPGDTAGKLKGKSPGCDCRDRNRGSVWSAAIEKIWSVFNIGMFASGIPGNRAPKAPPIDSVTRSTISAHSIIAPSVRY
jgi:hypothetical protein